MRNVVNKHKEDHAEGHFLRKRIAANLMVTGVVGFSLIMLLVATIVFLRFQTMENESIDEHLGRAESLLTEMQSKIRDKSLDWSIWTATYDFINDQNQDYLDENISLESLSNVGVDAVAFVGLDGVSRGSTYVDLDQWEVDEALANDFTAFATSPGSVLLASENEDFQGFARIGDRLLVVSFSQIELSDATGEANGYLVFGSEFKNDAASEALQVAVNYAFSPIERGENIIINNDHVHYAIEANTIQGTPLATINFETPRALKKTGQSLFLMMGFGIAILLFAMNLVLNRVFSKLVITPLTEMDKHVSIISMTGDLAPMPNDHRKDEIGKLNDGFNEMIQRLTSLRYEYEIQSFELGQTQKSIDVLHNVNNGISPINPILSRLTSLTEVPSKVEVAKAIDELKNEGLSPERRSKLILFVEMALEEFSSRMIHAKGLIVEADQCLTAVVAAIEQIQAGGSAPAETTSVAIKEFVLQHLALARYAENIAVDVNCDFLTSLPVDSNPIILGQIINNILVNATEAIAASGRQKGQINILCRDTLANGKDMLRLAISDNGEGFDPAMVNRLFERGYSTRTSKTGGTGLHWSANTLKSIGGFMEITSEGKNCGATVKIYLPLYTQQPTAADRQALAPIVAKAS